ncbi:TMEM175 family protein [Amaricoccus solimangrovi]|uniref:DUF1211 domain-containing protein n=1 Tax=Amaricoccus solimangrovi TaxID=2589815 RepID=A0A501WWV9_9RHOB|nr:TMEM175 family protein [Amaricoccus solimangrovi]TPE52634.1 DUF1211 domain-containing protein [Amaricoccus solimangrovi]
MTEDPGRPTPGGGFRRDGGGLEFDRVANFSDAVYAIAMTLLVFDLRVPSHLPKDASTAELLRGLTGIESGAFGFFLGFTLLGRYWVAHHRFFRALGSIDGRLVSLNLVYLAMVAFMPFPVSLLSHFEANRFSFGLFALSMASISLLEAVMFGYAARRGHIRVAVSRAALRHEMVGACAPVAVMLLSLPLAFWNTTAALASWLLMWPIGVWLSRREPADYRLLRTPPS